MNWAQPVFMRNERFSVPELMELLDNMSSFEDVISGLPPVRAKGGEVYIYKNEQKPDDWRADGYRWRQNGTKRLSQKKPTLNKIYFNITTPEGVSKSFQKEVFKPEGQHLVIIHYLGDETAAVDYPHGNCKTNNHNRTHHMTAPSVLQSLKENIDNTASEIYKRKVQKEFIPGHTTLLPRNQKQVSNAQYGVRQKNRMTKDALYNLHELAYDAPHFVKRIATFPDLMVICMDTRMAKEVQNLLLTHSPSPQMMTYDTTFQLGDFYVSPLLFRHTLLDGSPVMPLGFLIHERKFKETHEFFFKQVRREVPYFHSEQNTAIPLVTDDERALYEAAEEVLNNISPLQCWNHLINSLKMWLRQHGANSQEIPVLLQQVRELLHKETEPLYREFELECHAMWSQPMVEYVQKKIVPERTARWAIEKYGVYNLHSGVTTNMAEGFNTVLKRFLKWREVPLDTLVHCLQELQTYYLSEIQRAMCGVGQYRLMQEFRHYQHPEDECVGVPVMSPEDIAKNSSLHDRDCL